MTQVSYDYQDSWSEQDSIKPPVCVKCSSEIGKIIRMYVKRNGVSIPYGHDCAQIGDLYICPVCHIEIVQGFSKVVDKTISKQFLNSEYAILEGVQDVLF